MTATAFALIAALVSQSSGNDNGGTPCIDIPLHPLAVIGAGPCAVEGGEPAFISPLEAARFAWAALEMHGVEGAVICEVHSIEAPLTGYLVDALGSLTIEGARYDTFRVGIRDGRESDGSFAPAGEEFAFLAMGVDAEGDVCWIPAPGPGFAQVEGMLFDEVLLDYEFLLWRDEFESLSSRFALENPSSADDPGQE